MCMDLNTGLGSFLGRFRHSLSWSLSLPIGLCYHGKNIRFGGRKLDMNLINQTVCCQVLSKGHCPLSSSAERILQCPCFRVIVKNEINYRNRNISIQPHN